MDNSKSKWGRVLFALLAVTVILSMLLAACAPADDSLSGGGGQGGGDGGDGGKGNGGGNGDKGNDGGGGNDDKGKNDGGGNDNGNNNNNQQNDQNTGGGGDNNEVRGTHSGTPDPCMVVEGALPCGQGDHGRGNPINGSLHANCRAAQGEVDPICETESTPPPTEPPVTPPPTEPPTEPPNPPPPIDRVKPAPPPAASCPNWIVFHSFRTGTEQIFRLEGVEGTADAQLINLSNSTAMDSRPSRSPNDAFVVFQSNRQGNIELYMADSEGKQQTRLITTQSNNVNAMVGPDNEQVIYQSDRNGNWDLYLLNIKTGTDKQLTSNTADDVNPYWSPDPNWIVFQSNRTGTWNIYLLDVGTGTEYSVTNRPYDIVFPSWSPNGKQLAFFADWGGNWDLYVSDLHGGSIKRLTDQGNAGNASWSPDGNRIAYQIDSSNSNTDVFTYDLITNKEYQLTTFNGPDSAPSWDCGGNNISFTSTSGGSPNLYGVPWQGGDINYITNTPFTNKWSEWSPSKEPGSRGY